MPGQDGVSAAGGEVVQEFLLLAPFGALVAGVLFGAEILDYLPALAGGEHGLERRTEPGVPPGPERETSSACCFSRACSYWWTWASARGGAAGGEKADDFLLVAANPLPRAFQPVQDLLAGEEGMDVGFHGLLLLAVAQDFDGLKCESKSSHIGLESFPQAGGGGFGGGWRGHYLGRAATSFARWQSPGRRAVARSL